MSNPVQVPKVKESYSPIDKRDNEQTIPNPEEFQSQVDLERHRNKELLKLEQRVNQLRDDLVEMSEKDFQNDDADQKFDEMVKKHIELQEDLAKLKHLKELEEIEEGHPEEEAGEEKSQKSLELSLKDKNLSTLEEIENQLEVNQKRIDSLKKQLDMFENKGIVSGELYEHTKQLFLQAKLEQKEFLKEKLELLQLQSTYRRKRQEEAEKEKLEEEEIELKHELEDLNAEEKEGDILEEGLGIEGKEKELSPEEQGESLSKL